MNNHGKETNNLGKAMPYSEPTESTEATEPILCRPDMKSMDARSIVHGQTWERKKLLVLDVNGLLLFRKYKATSFPQEFDAVIGEFTIFIRPFAKEFLTWCCDNFIVVIWGTAMKQNLDPLIPLVFGCNQPHLVLTQAECSDTGLQHPTKRGKALLVKDIHRVWEHPNLQGFGFDETNTVLIDDAPYKAAWNPTLTAVHPKAWDPYDSENQPLNDCLGPEGDIRIFLMLFQECDDGRKAVKAWNESKQKNWMVTDSLCEFISRAPNPTLPMIDR